MAKQRYIVRGEGEYEDEKIVYAETAEEAAQQFGEDHIPIERAEESDVHVLVVTPTKQRLFFGVCRVSYMSASPLDDVEEEFAITSMRSHERYLKVRCPHCEAKPEEPCTRPSGKKSSVVHQKRISASISYLP